MTSVTNLVLSILCISSLIALGNAHTLRKNHTVGIIGGNPATDGQFPYQTAIYVTAPDGSLFFCGGALIDLRWILTSGRCVYRGGDYNFCLGSKSLVSEDPLRVCVYSNYSLAHPDYDPLTNENDIGLIRLDEPIQTNVYIKVIQLTRLYVGNGVNVTVSGWGATRDGDPMAYVLNYANLKTITNEECAQIYKPETISDTLVCATGTKTGLCTGDAGGPLIAKDSFNIDVLLGVVSWTSASSCQTNKPSLYTRTSLYIDWIESVIS